MPNLGDTDLKLTPMLDLDRCPHCNVATPLLNQSKLQQTKRHDGSNARFWAIYFCARCGGAVTAVSPQGDGIVEEIYPSGRGGPSEDLPPDVQRYLLQAMESLHAPDGAVMLAASAVDAMLKAKGYGQGTLYNRIDQTVADNVLTEDMGKWAHQVRLEANDMRHADAERPHMTEDEAKQCVEFALALGQILFVLPARVSRGVTASSPVA